MDKYIAYIDESGDPNFTEGASDTLYVGAVVLKESELDSISAAVDSIKERYRIVEFKSNRARSYERRVQICLELANLDIKLISVYVKKYELQGTWFRYRRGFYKYIQKLLNREIYRLFGNVHVQLDKFGSPDYQKSLELYLEKSMQVELFSPEVTISSAKKNKFIQIADYISGSIRKQLLGDFDGDTRISEAFEPIWKVNLHIPDTGRFVTPFPELEGGDSISFCVEEAYRYLESQVELKETAKYIALDYLYHSALTDPEEFIYTGELLNWLSNHNIELGEEQFRNEVTAALRDSGLIIVGTRKGYKIPTTLEDFQEYVSFSVNLVLPVLKRLKKGITFFETKIDRDISAEILSEEMLEILNKVNA